MVMTEKPMYYDPMNAAIIWMYLEQYPDVALEVARSMGYPPKDGDINAQALHDWYDELLHQYWVADAVTGKTGRDARIWLKSSMTTARTSGELVDKIQATIREKNAA